MFTLVYLKGQFNRPETLMPFLQTNAGNEALVQVDCITPFAGSKADLTEKVCQYLSNVDPDFMVINNVADYSNTESSSKDSAVDYLVIQVHVQRK